MTPLSSHLPTLFHRGHIPSASKPEELSDVFLSSSMCLSRWTSLFSLTSDLGLWNSAMPALGPLLGQMTVGANNKVKLRQRLGLRCFSGARSNTQKPEETRCHLLSDIFLFLTEGPMTWWGEEKERSVMSCVLSNFRSKVYESNINIFFVFEFLASIFLFYIHLFVCMFFLDWTLIFTFSSSWIATNIIF